MSFNLTEHHAMQMLGDWVGTGAGLDIVVRGKIPEIESQLAIVIVISEAVLFKKLHTAAKE